MKTAFSLLGKNYRENPVLALYWPIMGLQCMILWYTQWPIFKVSLLTQGTWPLELQMNSWVVSYSHNYLKAKVCQQNPAPGMFCSFNMIWYNKILPILKPRADILTTISLFFFWKFDTSQFCSEIIWFLVLTFTVSELRVGKKCSSRFRHKSLQ